MLKRSHLRKYGTPEEESLQITKGHVVKPVAKDIHTNIEMLEPNNEQKDENGHKLPFYKQC